MNPIGSETAERAVVVFRSAADLRRGDPCRRDPHDRRGQGRGGAGPVPDRSLDLVPCFTAASAVVQLGRRFGARA